MLDKYCDILVIGKELPGLVSAAFLARRGLAVQVIDTDFYTDHPSLPDPLCLTHVKSKLLRSILGRLNVPENTISHFLSRESTLQVIFPKNRIDIFENPLFYEEEIDREFPQYHDTLKNFYETLARTRHQIDINELFQQLIPSTWRERNHFKKFVREQNLDQKSEDYIRLLNSDMFLGNYLKSQFQLAYHALCDEPFTHQVAELFNPSDGGIFSVMGGQKELRDILLERIIAFDGKIRGKVSIEKLLFRNGVFEGVELAGSQETVLAKYIIWNSSLEKLKDVLPNKWRFRSLKKKCENYPSSYHWFTLRFHLPNTFLPDPLKPNAVVIHDPKRPLNGSNFLYLQIRPLRNTESSYIDVNFLLPKSALEENFSYFQSFFDEIRQTLIEMLPFSQNHLKQLFPRDTGNAELDTLFPLHENDFEVFKHSARVHGITEYNHASFSDFFDLHYRTAAPNLILSHPYIFQPFGMDAKLTLGLKVTDLIWQEAEKEKKRAMKSERKIA